MTKNFFDKNESETTEEFILRLCSKKNEFGLSWQDLSDIANESCGLTHSESWYRKKYSNYIVNNICDNIVNENDTEEEDVKTLEDVLSDIRQEKQRVRDERVTANALYRRLDREQTIKDIAESAALIVGKSKPLPSVKEFTTTNRKSAILALSDWHYGATVNHFANIYNTDVARRRISYVIDEAIRIGELNRLCEIYVLNLGDLISGRIHSQIRINNQEDVITQIMEVSEIMAECLNKLSAHFIVHFYSTEDNHSRIEPNKKESLSLETLTRVTHWYLKTRCFDNPNIRIYDNKYGEDIATVEDINGLWNVVAVHGDKDNIHNVVPNLTLLTRRHYDIAFTAHKHHFSADERNDCIVIANPSLMGTDDYSKDLRFTSRPAQTMVIVGEQTPIESIYYISPNV